MQVLFRHDEIGIIINLNVKRAGNKLRHILRPPFVIRNMNNWRE